MIIEPFENTMNRAERHYFSPPAKVQEMRQLRDDALKRLDTFKKLLALTHSLPKRTRTTIAWHLDGAKLLEMYRLDSDSSAGISPNGPPVNSSEHRFNILVIQDCLQILDPDYITPGIGVKKRCCVYLRTTSQW